MLTTSQKCTMLLLVILALACGLLANIHHIHAWEKANGYPFGRMCDPNFFNIYTDTCRK